MLRKYCFILNDSCFFRAFRRIIPCHPWIQHRTSADSAPTVCFLPEKADTAPPLSPQSFPVWNIADSPQCKKHLTLFTFFNELLCRKPGNMKLRRKDNCSARPVISDCVA